MNHYLWLIRTYLAVEEYPEAAGIIEILKGDPLFPERLKEELYENAVTLVLPTEYFTTVLLSISKKHWMLLPTKKKS
jgi:hypothetical protein